MPDVELMAAINSTKSRTHKTAQLKWPFFETNLSILQIKSPVEQIKKDTTTLSVHFKTKTSLAL